MWDIRAPYAAPADQEKSLEVKLLKGIAAFKGAQDQVTRMQCEEELHEIMSHVEGRENVDLVSALIAVLKLGNNNLAVSALNALANLDGEGARAVPAVLEAGLSGKRILLINASCALKSIRGSEAVDALVQLFEKPDPLGKFKPAGTKANEDALVQLFEKPDPLGKCTPSSTEAEEKSKEYKKRRCWALENFTLPAFLEHGQACIPFISRVEDALCAIRPERADKITAKLNGLRVRLRRDRLREYSDLDLPGDVDLDPLRDAPDEPVSNIVDIQLLELPRTENPIISERFRFTLRYTKGEVGLEIHELSGYNGLRYLVLAIQDEDAFGVEVGPAMPTLASAIGTRYGLAPHATYWGLHTTRESGLTSKRCDEYTLYVLRNDPDTGRYKTFHEFDFDSLPAMVSFLDASYNL